MKKYINLILGISFLILLSLVIWINYLVKNNVGYITFNSNLDNSSFELCDENRVFQYYSVGTSYVGERKALRESIYAYLKKEKYNVDFGAQSGYITFRFIVNCNGKSGRFRYKEVDENFAKTIFKKTEVEKLKNAVKKLDNWNAGTLKNGTTVDSYNQINFKIIDGVIEAIF